MEKVLYIRTIEIFYLYWYTDITVCCFLQSKWDHRHITDSTVKFQINLFLLKKN